MELEVEQTIEVPDPLALMKELERKGGEVLAKCCSTKPAWSKRRHAMLPGLPKETYRDLYSKSELAKKKNKVKREYDESRVDHEAEIIVYKALESLYDQREKLETYRSKHLWSDDTEMIVLHSLHYTKQQFEYFVSTIIKPSEKEHDFVVILRDRAIVLIEVKRPRYAAGQSAEKKFDKFTKMKTDMSEKRAQLRRMEALLGGIKQKLNLEADLKILKFIAFPKRSKEELSEDDVKRLCGRYLTEEVLVKQDSLANFDKECAIRELNILFEEDFKCFGKWWKDNVIKNIPETDDQHDVSTKGLESVLAGLRFTGHDSDDNLMTDIQKIDEDLRSEKLYLKVDRRSENFPNFSEHDPYRPIFRTFLGIAFITNEQKEVLAEDKLFLNCVAGSGKTILVQAKLIRLATDLGNTRQIIVFLTRRDTVNKYKTVLERPGSGIKDEEIEEIDFDQIIHLFSSSMRSASSTIEQLTASSKDSSLSTSTITKQYPATLESRLVNCESKKIVFIYNIALNADLRRRYPLIIHYLYERLDNLILQKDKYHILVDDFQTLLSLKFKDPKMCGDIHIVDRFVDILKVNSPTSSASSLWTHPRTTWIACDIFQILEFGVFGDNDCSTEVKTFLSDIENGTIKTKSLTYNLRNTLAIGNLLGEIRKKLNTLTDMNLGNQVVGHFINGPTPYVYCVRNLGQVKNVIRDELMLTNIEPNANTINSTSIDIVVIPIFKIQTRLRVIRKRKNEKKLFRKNRKEFDVDKLVSMLQAEADGLKIKIKSVTHGPKYTYSLEYPIGLLIVDLRRDIDDPQQDPDSKAFANLLAYLYLGISRARVSCTIIFLCDQFPINPMLKQIIEILRDFVVIKVY